MSHYSIGLDELLAAVEELNLQFNLIEEDLDLPDDTFRSDVFDSYSYLSQGEWADEPFDMAKHLVIKEDNLIDKGPKPIKALLLVLQLANLFKYNDRLVYRDELQSMPPRHHRHVDPLTLKEAYDLWQKRLGNLLSKHELDVDEEIKPLLTFELRSRAQSIGIEWFNLFVHFDFDHMYASLHDIPVLAEVYLEAVELAKEFPYNNFRLDLKNGDDLINYSSWINVYHL